MKTRHSHNFVTVVGYARTYNINSNQFETIQPLNDPSQVHLTLDWDRLSTFDWLAWQGIQQCHPSKVHPIACILWRMNDNYCPFQSIHTYFNSNFNSNFNFNTNFHSYLSQCVSHAQLINQSCLAKSNFNSKLFFYHILLIVVKLHKWPVIRTHVPCKSIQWQIRMQNWLVSCLHLISFINSQRALG